MTPDPLDELRIDAARLAAAEQELTEVRADVQRGVIDARRAGVTWSAIGDVLGITRQSAQQRFGRARIPLEEPQPQPQPKLTRQQRRAQERRGS